MNEFIDEKLRTLSDAMEVEIKYCQEKDSEGKVLPAYDVNSIISKMIALLVYSGLHVPSSFSPSYNSVHAGVEYWKRRREEHEKATEPKPLDQPVAEQPPVENNPDGAPESQ